VKLDKLLGLPYPWVNHIAVTSAGVGWFIAANSREFKDKPKEVEASVAQGFIHRVTGL
jgi:hypothetical protein